MGRVRKEDLSWRCLLVNQRNHTAILILEGIAAATEEVIALPDPIGAADTIFTLHSEVRTFPPSFGCGECSFRLSLSPAVLERVRALVGADDEAVAQAAREAVPASAKTVSIHQIEAEDERGAVVTVTATTGPMADWGIGGSIVSTAAPAAAAVRLLARGRIERRGALPPELCVDPDDLFPELERRGCEFAQRFTNMS